MKRVIRFLALLSWIAAVSAVWAAPPQVDWAAVDRDLQYVAQFQFGQSPDPLNRIQELCVRSLKEPSLRSALEFKLIETLQHAKTYEAVDFLCRRLRTIGTSRCLPYLAPLLVQEKTAHIARYAVGRMEGEEASHALFVAAQKTKGKIRAGLITSLAKRDYMPAQDFYIQCLQGKDPVVATAAAGALGRLATRPAAEALLQALTHGSKAEPQTVENALLTCAERLLQAGDRLEAAKIYHTLEKVSEAKRTRLAVLRGKLLLEGPKAAKEILQLIQSGPEPWKSLAVSLVTEGKDPDVTLVFASALPQFGVQDQARMIRLLGARHDPTAVSPILHVLQTTDSEEVQAAAFEVLPTLGGKSLLLPLCRIAAKASPRIQALAVAELNLIQAKDLDSMILKALPQESPPVQAVLLRLIAIRKPSGAEAALEKLIQSPNPTVRQQAYRALATLGGPHVPEVLLRQLVQTHSPEELKVLEEALQTSIQKLTEKQQAAAAEQLLAALQQASIAQKEILFRLLPLTPTKEALRAVAHTLRRGDPVLRKVALNTLAHWPRPDAIRLLLAVARRASHPAEKKIAFQAIARLSGQVENPADVLQQAFQLATTPADRKMLLSGLATASSLQALELAESMLKDPAVQAEAGLAVVQIADRVRASNPSRARTALQKVLAIVKEKSVLQQAKQVLYQIDKYKGYILKWQISEPFRIPGKTSLAVFRAVFPPEEGKPVKWTPLTKGIGSWSIDLTSAVGSYDHCAVYLRTRIWVPRAMKARLELGSDDAIKVWLNGRLVHAHYVDRGIQPAQDIVPVSLQRGWNELLVKVVNHEGGWAVAARVVDPEGFPIPDIKVAP